MNSATRTILSLVIVLAGAVGFYLLGEPEVFKRPPEKPIPPAVKTVAADEHTDGIQFVVDGVVVPYRQIQIAAQVSGRVEFKSSSCRVGRAVKKGDLLLTIEKEDYDLEVKRLTEELTQADASLAELNAELSTAEHQIASAEQQLEIELRQLKRSNDLVARRITSDAEVDDARRAELTSRNSLQTLVDQKKLILTRRIRLESAKALGLANLEKAKLALKRTEIYSPIDGVVVSESVEQDGFVQTGSAVISLQDSSQLDVSCKLRMKQMHWLWQAATGEIRDVSQAYDFPETEATVLYSIGDNSYAWKGVVNRYDGAGVDSATRMVPCLVNVDDPLEVTPTSVGEEKYATSSPPTLMTGMYVKVRIDARPPIKLVRLPQEAVQPGNTVWTREDGKLRQKNISIATSSGDFVIAYQEADGLQAGDQVVVTPLATPVEGQEVVDAENLPEGYQQSGSGGWPGGPGAGGGKERGTSTGGKKPTEGARPSADARQGRAGS